MNAIVNEKYHESELTGKVIGCCMEVHRFLGNGFQEVIYQRALAIEFSRQNISFSREHEMDLLQGRKYKHKTRCFFVEGKVMVELKAVIHLEDVHLARAINYVGVRNRTAGELSSKE
jgi:GxxExxY protein